MKIPSEPNTTWGRNAKAHQSLSTPYERAMTLMMCDLVESTRLVDLGTSELRRLFLCYYALCLSTMESVGGRLIRYVGDGALGVFDASGDSKIEVRAAIESALTLRREIESIPMSDGTSLSVRISIVTGRGITTRLHTSLQSHQEEIFGELPFLANRLMSHVDPGSVIVCDRTARHALGRFDLNRLGAVNLKGFSAKRVAWILADD